MNSLIDPTAIALSPALNNCQVFTQILLLVISEQTSGFMRQNRSRPIAQSTLALVDLPLRRRDFKMYDLNCRLK